MPSVNEKMVCKKKVRFTSEAAAKSALKKINLTWKLKKPSRAYKCPVCSDWHLTSQRK